MLIFVRGAVIEYERRGRPIKIIKNYSGINPYGVDYKYSTIYADPPWYEKGGGKIKRGADRHYPLMKTDDIAAIAVQKLVDPVGCHLYLWATNNFLQDALWVMHEWGFTYKTMITWTKNAMGLGQYFRGITEHCLFGTYKTLPYKTDKETGKRCQGVTGFFEPKQHHSRKPDTMRRMIEKVSYAPRIELFAREKFDGWDILDSH